MANSGSGEVALERADAAPTAANSQPSRPKGKPNTKGARKQEQYGPSEALEFLNSAVGYLNRAGLRVTYINQEGRLVLFIRGARYVPDASTGIPFEPVLAPPAPTATEQGGGERHGN